MKILVTGGAGYIGSHTCLNLLEAGHEVTVLDNLSNSRSVVLERVTEVARKPINFVRGDIRNAQDLDRALCGGIDAVIHFAAFKAVGESCAKPLQYFNNNISGSISLMQAMEIHGVTRLVFSSSATVYGQPKNVPVSEDASLSVNSPYGRSKLVVEQLIQDWAKARPDVSAVHLRYFNPAGAHPSGRIGEDSTGEPNNLMPYLAQVAVGRRERLRVFGSDYPTPDGTGIRDFIHVMDLADAHVRAVEYVSNQARCEVFNIGTGRGYSVLEVVRAFEAESKRSIPLEFTERRAGDVSEITADPSRARSQLGWSARLGLQEMCEDTWRWQSANPDGFD